MRKSMKQTVLAALVGAICAPQAWAAPLESELKNVLDIHPAIKASRTAVEAADKRLAASKGAYFPKVTLSGDSGKEEITSTSYKPDGKTPTMTLGNDGTITPNQTSNLYRNKRTLSIEQGLYNGGRREAIVDMANIDYQIQSYALASQTQDVLLEALAAYLQVGRYQTLIGLSKLNEETTSRQLEMETKRVQGGGGIAVDVLQARTRLQIVRERRVFYEQGLRDASANYEQVFGRPPVLDAIQELDVAESKLPGNVVIALEKALEKNPKMLMAGLQVDKAKKSMQLENSAFAPTVDLVGARSSDTNVNQVAKREETSLLLKVNWVLFSGMDTSNRVAAASKDLDEQEARQTLAANKMRETVRVQWNQQVNGMERLELLDSAAAISRDVMENRKKLRDAGKEPALSVLDAEVEYYGVLANKVNALYDVRIGSYKLLHAIGELTPENIGIDTGFSLPVQPLTVDLSKISASIRKK